MVLGGVVLNRLYEPNFGQALGEYREQYRMHNELKWVKVSRSKLEEYKAFIDLFFEHRRYLHFKSMVIDTRQIDNRRFNKGSYDLGFYKLMYQFLLHSFGRYLAPQDSCIVTLDQRNTQNYKLGAFYKILNNGLRKQYKFEHFPVREIKVADSRSVDLIQAADLFMGAIGYEVNGDCDKPNASPAKCDLMRHILRKAGVTSFKRGTPLSKRDFSIWHFQFGGAKRR